MVAVAVIVGDVACERMAAVSLLSLGRERVAVVASSLVTWHERGAGGGADVGGMAVERAAVVLTWHTKRWRQRLALTVTWHVVGLWMRDEMGGGGQWGGATHLWTPFPGLLALPTSSSSSNLSSLLSANLSSSLWSSNLVLLSSLNQLLSSCA